MSFGLVDVLRWGLLRKSAAQAAAAVLGFVGVNAGGELISPSGDVAPLTKHALAGRYAPRGRLRASLGGSETARGLTVKSCNAGQVVFNSTTKQIAVQTNQLHGMHSGANVFLAAEDAIAPGLNGGTVTVDNMFAYGQITVVDDNNFTMPYWSLMAGTRYYDTNPLGGMSTLTFYVFRQELFSPNGKLNEANRLLGHPLTLVLNIGTGSNNSSNLVERIPALVALARAGLINAVDGTLGVGNTALYGLNHSWTIAQILTQAVGDVTAMCKAWAPLGVDTTLELQVAQLNSSGITIGGTEQIIQAFTKLAADPSLRLHLCDDYSQSFDPATGLQRARYARNGNDNVHPSNEGAVHYAMHRAEAMRYTMYPHSEFLARNPLDSYFADTTSTMQYFDPLSSTTPTNAASGLDAKCTGVVPDLVTVITTAGNAGRAVAFSYVKIGEIWCIVARITAAAAADSFLVRLTNKPGARMLKNILNALPAHTFRCGADFCFIPLTGSWTSIDTFFSTTESYGSISGRVAVRAADSYNDSVYVDGPMTGPRNGPARLPDFTLQSGGTCTDAGLSFVATAAAAGTGILIIAMPTIRDVT